MKKLLEEIWCEGIHPMEEALKMTPEIKEYGRQAESFKEKLVSTFSVEQKELFDKYLIIRDKLSMISEKDVFVYAFGFGMQLTIEGFGK